MCPLSGANIFYYWPLETTRAPRDNWALKGDSHGVPLPVPVGVDQLTPAVSTDLSWVIISGCACSRSPECDSDPGNQLCFIWGPWHADRRTALKCASESDQIMWFIFEVLHSLQNGWLGCLYFEKKKQCL